MRVPQIMEARFFSRPCARAATIAGSHALRYTVPVRITLPMGDVNTFPLVNFARLTSGDTTATVSGARATVRRDLRVLGGPTKYPPAPSCFHA